MHPSSLERARPYIAWSVLLGIAVAVAVIALPASGAEDGEEELENPVAFAETSYANVCAECHGGDGLGGTVPGTDSEAPALTDDSAAYLDLVLRTGRMPPPGDPFDNRAREVYYTDVEREAMVAWMVDAFDLPSDIPEVGEGDVSAGLETFALNCAHCHGNAGAGGVAGQRAWTPEVTHLDPVAIAEAIRVGPFEMPAFGDDQLSDTDVDDIVAYLEAVDDEPGTILGLVELNPVFASGFVGVVALALMGALLFIGGRPQPFERVPEEEIGAQIDRPEGQTPMPGDPAYERAVGDVDRDHEPVPYTDEGKSDRGTSDAPQAVTADELDRDEQEGPQA